MCIQYCNDGDSSGVQKVLSVARETTLEKVIGFLQWDVDDEYLQSALGDINRDDTLDYMLYYPDEFGITKREREIIQQLAG